MKVLLLADGVVGAKIAEFLMKHHREDLVLVVTMQFNDLYREVEAMGIPVCIFDSEQNVLDKIEAKGVDLGLLVWWPKLLKSPLLDAPRYGFLNTHPSLLPHNRGKHYNFWALVEQVPFGVTIHRADSGVDTGDIVAQDEIAYDWTDSGESLYNKAQEAMVDLFCKTYPVLRTGSWESKPQLPNEGSFHRASELESVSRISLDSSYKARELLNLLRARTFDGYPACWFEESGNRYEISIKIKKVNK